MKTLVSMQMSTGQSLPGPSPAPGATICLSAEPGGLRAPKLLLTEGESLQICGAAGRGRTTTLRGGTASTVLCGGRDPAARLEVPDLAQALCKPTPLHSHLFSWELSLLLFQMRTEAPARCGPLTEARADWLDLPWKREPRCALEKEINGRRARSPSRVQG